MSGRLAAASRNDAWERSSEFPGRDRRNSPVDDAALSGRRELAPALRAELREYPAITATQMDHRDPRMTLRVCTNVTGLRPRTRLGGLLNDVSIRRLRAREHYTERDDYVFCSRLGRRLDASAVRRRYKRARDVVGLRKLRFHSLRHAAGSLVAREADARFVQAFLGHSRLSTTERYLHAKSRPQDVETLNRAFASRVAK